jgi:hypothetical protein
MIRVYKTPNIPDSLTSTASYNGEDVKQQLLADQHDKCYICERYRDTDFEIEHHKSQKNHPELIQDWNNLFMGCRYCNGKKSNDYDDILNPKDCNIEDEIEQRIDFANKKAVFASSIDDVQHHETVRLLERVFNGTKQVRTKKEERFIEQAISIVNKFSDLIICYLMHPDASTEKAIKDELAIDKELLGFKYWIIRDTPSLYQTFSQDIIWNK